MTPLVRAEWTKLFSTRVWIGLLLGSCALVGLFAALLTAFAGVVRDGRSGAPPLGSPQFERLAFAVGANATMFLLILGIIGMTQEYRHRTATPTFLTTPRRGRVVAAKLVAYALAAVPFAAVVLGVAVGVVTIYAGARGAAPSFRAENLRILAGAAAALVIYAVIGVGVGALLRNQVGAIVGSLVFLLVAEPLIRSIGPISGTYKWMPGGATEALTATSRGIELLQPWQGGLLLLGYGLLAALLGTVLTVRRDAV